MPTRQALARDACACVRPGLVRAVLQPLGDAADAPRLWAWVVSSSFDSSLGSGARDGTSCKGCGCPLPPPGPAPPHWPGGYSAKYGPYFLVAHLTPVISASNSFMSWRSLSTLGRRSRASGGGSSAGSSSGGVGSSSGSSSSAGTTALLPTRPTQYMADMYAYVAWGTTWRVAKLDSLVSIPCTAAPGGADGAASCLSLQVAPSAQARILGTYHHTLAAVAMLNDVNLDQRLAPPPPPTSSRGVAPGTLPAAEADWLASALATHPTFALHHSTAPVTTAITDPAAVATSGAAATPAPPPPLFTLAYVSQRLTHSKRMSITGAAGTAVTPLSEASSGGQQSEGSVFFDTATNALVDGSPNALTAGSSPVPVAGEAAYSNPLLLVRRPSVLALTGGAQAAAAAWDAWVRDLSASIPVVPLPEPVASTGAAGAAAHGAGASEGTVPTAGGSGLLCCGSSGGGRKASARAAPAAASSKEALTSATAGVFPTAKHAALVFSAEHALQLTGGASELAALLVPLEPASAADVAVGDAANAQRLHRLARSTLLWFEPAVARLHVRGTAARAVVSAPPLPLPVLALGRSGASPPGSIPPMVRVSINTAPPFLISFVQMSLASLQASACIDLADVARGLRGLAPGQSLAAGTSSRRASTAVVPAPFPATAATAAVPTALGGAIIALSAIDVLLFGEVCAEHLARAGLLRQALVEALSWLQPTLKAAALVVAALITGGPAALHSASASAGIPLPLWVTRLIKALAAPGTAAASRPSLCSAVYAASTSLDFDAPVRILQLQSGVFKLVTLDRSLKSLEPASNPEESGQLVTLKAFDVVDREGPPRPFEALWEALGLTNNAQQPSASSAPPGAAATGGGRRHSCVAPAAIEATAAPPVVFHPPFLSFTVPAKLVEPARQALLAAITWPMTYSSVVLAWRCAVPVCVGGLCGITLLGGFSCRDCQHAVLLVLHRALADFVADAAVGVLADGNVADIDVAEAVFGASHCDDDDTDVCTGDVDSLLLVADTLGSSIFKAITDACASVTSLTSPAAWCVWEGTDAPAAAVTAWAALLNAANSFAVWHHAGPDANRTWQALPNNIVIAVLQRAVTAILAARGGPLFAPGAAAAAPAGNRDSAAALAGLQLLYGLVSLGTQGPGAGLPGAPIVRRGVPRSALAIGLGAGLRATDPTRHQLADLLGMLATAAAGGPTAPIVLATVSLGAVWPCLRRVLQLPTLVPTPLSAKVPLYELRQAIARAGFMALRYGDAAAPWRSAVISGLLVMITDASDARPEVVGAIEPGPAGLVRPLACVDAGAAVAIEVLAAPAPGTLHGGTPTAAGMEALCEIVLACDPAAPANPAAPPPLETVLCSAFAAAVLVRLLGHEDSAMACCAGPVLATGVTPPSPTGLPAELISTAFGALALSCQYLNMAATASLAGDHSAGIRVALTLGLKALPLLLAPGIGGLPAFSSSAARLLAHAVHVQTGHAQFTPTLLLQAAATHLCTVAVCTQEEVAGELLGPSGASASLRQAFSAAAAVLAALAPQAARGANGLLPPIAAATAAAKVPAGVRGAALGNTAAVKLVVAAADAAAALMRGTAPGPNAYGEALATEAAVARELSSSGLIATLVNALSLEARARDTWLSLADPDEVLGLDGPPLLQMLWGPDPIGAASARGGAGLEGGADGAAGAAAAGASRLGGGTTTSSAPFSGWGGYLSLSMGGIGSVGSGGGGGADYASGGGAGVAGGSFDMMPIMPSRSSGGGGAAASGGDNASVRSGSTRRSSGGASVAGGGSALTASRLTLPKMPALPAARGSAAAAASAAMRVGPQAVEVDPVTGMPLNRVVRVLRVYDGPLPAKGGSSSSSSTASNAVAEAPREAAAPAPAAGQATGAKAVPRLGLGLALGAAAPAPAPAPLEPLSASDDAEDDDDAMLGFHEATGPSSSPPASTDLPLDLMLDDGVDDVPGSEGSGLFVPTSARSPPVPGLRFTVPLPSLTGALSEEEGRLDDVVAAAVGVSAGASSSSSSSSRQAGAGTSSAAAGPYDGDYKDDLDGLLITDGPPVAGDDGAVTSRTEANQPPLHTRRGVPNLPLISIAAAAGGAAGGSAPATAHLPAGPGWGTMPSFAAPLVPTAAASTLLRFASMVSRDYGAGGDGGGSLLYDDPEGGGAALRGSYGGPAATLTNASNTIGGTALVGVGGGSRAGVPRLRGLMSGAGATSGPGPTTVGAAAQLVAQRGPAGSSGAASARLPASVFASPETAALRAGAGVSATARSATAGEGGAPLSARGYHAALQRAPSQATSAPVLQLLSSRARYHRATTTAGTEEVTRGTSTQASMQTEGATAAIGLDGSGSSVVGLTTRMTKDSRAAAGSFLFTGGMVTPEIVSPLSLGGKTRRPGEVAGSLNFALNPTSSPPDSGVASSERRRGSGGGVGVAATRGLLHAPDAKAAGVASTARNFASSLVQATFVTAALQAAGSSLSSGGGASGGLLSLGSLASVRGRVESLGSAPQAAAAASSPVDPQGSPLPLLAPRAAQLDASSAEQAVVAASPLPSRAVPPVPAPAMVAVHRLQTLPLPAPLIPETTALRRALSTLVQEAEPMGLQETTSGSDEDKSERAAPTEEPPTRSKPVTVSPEPEEPLVAGGSASPDVPVQRQGGRPAGLIINVPMLVMPQSTKKGAAVRLATLQHSHTPTPIQFSMTPVPDSAATKSRTKSFSMKAMQAAAASGGSGLNSVRSLLSRRHAASSRALLSSNPGDTALTISEGGVGTVELRDIDLASVRTRDGGGASGTGGGEETEVTGTLTSVTRGGYGGTLIAASSQQFTATTSSSGAGRESATRSDTAITSSSGNRSADGRAGSASLRRVGASPVRDSLTTGRPLVSLNSSVSTSERGGQLDSRATLTGGTDAFSECTAGADSRSLAEEGAFSEGAGMSSAASGGGGGGTSIASVDSFAGTQRSDFLAAAGEGMDCAGFPSGSGNFRLAVDLRTGCSTARLSGVKFDEPDLPPVPVPVRLTPDGPEYAWMHLGGDAVPCLLPPLPGINTAAPKEADELVIDAITGTAAPVSTMVKAPAGGWTHLDKLEVAVAPATVEGKPAVSMTYLETRAASELYKSMELHAGIVVLLMSCLLRADGMAIREELADGYAPPSGVTVGSGSVGGSFHAPSTAAGSFSRLSSLVPPVPLATLAAAITGGASSARSPGSGRGGGAGGGLGRAGSARGSSLLASDQQLRLPLPSGSSGASSSSALYPLPHTQTPSARPGLAGSPLSLRPYGSSDETTPAGGQLRAGGGPRSQALLLPFSPGQSGLSFTSLGLPAGTHNGSLMRVNSVGGGGVGGSVEFGFTAGGEGGAFDASGALALLPASQHGTGGLRPRHVPLPVAIHEAAGSDVMEVLSGAGVKGSIGESAALMAQKGVRLRRMLTEAVGNPDVREALTAALSARDGPAIPVGSSWLGPTLSVSGALPASTAVTAPSLTQALATRSSGSSSSGPLLMSGSIQLLPAGSSGSVVAAGDAWSHLLSHPLYVLQCHLAHPGNALLVNIHVQELCEARGRPLTRFLRLLSPEFFQPALYSLQAHIASGAYGTVASALAAAESPALSTLAALRRAFANGVQAALTAGKGEGAGWDVATAAAFGLPGGAVSAHSVDSTASSRTSVVFSPAALVGSADGFDLAAGSLDSAGGSGAPMQLMRTRELRLALPSSSARLPGALTSRSTVSSSPRAPASGASDDADRAPARASLAAPSAPSNELAILGVDVAHGREDGSARSGSGGDSTPATPLGPLSSEAKARRRVGLGLKLPLKGLHSNSSSGFLPTAAEAATAHSALELDADARVAAAELATSSASAAFYTPPAAACVNEGGAAGPELPGLFDTEVAVKIVTFSEDPLDRFVLSEVLPEVAILEELTAPHLLAPAKGGPAPRSDTNDAAFVAAAGALGGPPCTALLDYGVTSTAAWVIMERCPASLRTWRRTEAGAELARLPLPPAAALDIFLAIGARLRQLHAAGIAHYDLKCDNVMLRQGYGPALAVCANGGVLGSAALQPWASLLPYVALADFGESVARPGFTARTISFSTEGLGTEFSRPPEMLLGGGWTKRFPAPAEGEASVAPGAGPSAAACDVWSWGCLLFELVTGDFLFQTDIWVAFFRTVTGIEEEDNNSEAQAAGAALSVVEGSAATTGTASVPAPVSATIPEPPSNRTVVQPEALAKLQQAVGTDAAAVLQRLLLHILVRDPYRRPTLEGAWDAALAARAELAALQAAARARNGAEAEAEGPATSPASQAVPFLDY